MIKPSKLDKEARIIFTLVIFQILTVVMSIVCDFVFDLAGNTLCNIFRNSYISCEICFRLCMFIPILSITLFLAYLDNFQYTIIRKYILNLF